MTTAQEKFIRENYRRFSIVDMARKLDLLPDEVLEFVTNNRLGVTRPVLPERTNHVVPYKRRNYSHKSFTDNDKLL